MCVEVIVVTGIERARLPWVEQDQHTMSGCSDCGRRVADTELRRIRVEVRFIPSFDRLDCIVHGRLNDGDIEETGRARTPDRNRRRAWRPMSYVSHSDRSPVSDGVRVCRHCPAQADTHEES